jgi:hypothetical protein
MLRHDHVTNDDQLIALAHLLQDGKKQNGEAVPFHETHSSQNKA